MTITETRPVAVAHDDEPAATATVPDTWLTTGDHKRLGILFIAGGLVALIAGCAIAVAFQVQADGPTAWTAAGSRLASANTVVTLLIGIPALWIGLATYVVPLQIGATRLALPRLHNLALWTYFWGGVLVAVAFTAGRPQFNSLLSSAPPLAVKGQRASTVTELLIAGLFVIGLALFLSAVSLLTTVLLRRAEGLRLPFVPLFSSSVLGTATTLVLATPVFLGGLALLAYDQHYGGTLFAGKGGARIWQHELWLLGQPLALVFAAAGIGVFGDIVSTHARRPLSGYGVARVAATAAPLLTLFLWTGTLGALGSPLGPLARPGAVVVALAFGVSLLCWLGTLKDGQRRLHPSLLFLVAYLAVIGLAGAFSIVALSTKMTPLEAEAFRNGQITLLVFAAPLLALAGAAAHWSPKLWGRATPTGLGALQALLLLAGAVLTALPAYLVGFGASASIAPVGAAGSAITAAGLLFLVVNLASRRATTDADPYDGMTLEWATSSPPPVHNFDELPDIRSPHPLADAGATSS